MEHQGGGQSAGKPSPPECSFYQISEFYGAIAAPMGDFALAILAAFPRFFLKKFNLEESPRSYS